MSAGQTGEYSVGSLVRVRERDWVVLPSDDADILCLRPLAQTLPFSISQENEGRGFPNLPSAFFVES
jgi:hypothetical protein